MHVYALEVVNFAVACWTFPLVFFSWRVVQRALGAASIDPDAKEALMVARWKCRIYGWLLFIAALLAIGAIGGVFLDPPDTYGQFWAWEQITPARLTVLAVNVALGMAFLTEQALREEMRSSR